MRRCLLLVLLITLLPSPGTARAMQVTGPQGTVTVTAGNVAFSGPLLDNRYLIYGAATPGTRPVTCSKCQKRPFTNFTVRVFSRRYRIQPNGIEIEPARLLFSAPRGARLRLFSLAHGWLIYAPYLPGQDGSLYAREIGTGRTILLDSPPVPPLGITFRHASTDGTTVVWETVQRVSGNVITLIRSYSLTDGRRSLLLAGTNGNSQAYAEPLISGKRLLVAFQPTRGASAQLLVGNTTTKRIRPLTASGQPNHEPALSGDIVAWMHGLASGSKHVLVIANLVTGRRVMLSHTSTLLPRILAGRWVIFATDGPRPSVQAYDAITGRRWVVAPPAAPQEAGYAGGGIQVGGRVVLYPESVPCTSAPGQCPLHLRLVAVP